MTAHRRTVEPAGEAWPADVRWPMHPAYVVIRPGEHPLAFTPEERDRAVALCGEDPGAGQMLADHIEDEVLKARVKEIFHTVNAQTWRLDLAEVEWRSIPDVAMYCNVYGQWSGQRPHTDITDRQAGGLKLFRKLALSVLLSDWREFTGGEFRFCGAFDEWHAVNMGGRGGVLVVGPGALHEVSVVRSGLRRALVCTVNGPPLR
jgi:hypothetical protein